MHSPILLPVVALVGWTLVMLVWATIARFPELKRLGVDINTVRGSKPGGLDGVASDSAQWKMHNYMHLTEQPVLFYAVCGVLALAEAGGGLNTALAWGYVGVRIAHSLVQATSNIIRFRFAVFALSTIILMMLTVHAGMAAAGMHHL
ncbi:MAG: MAPEG family protein [Polymorphobacter sp.]